MDRVTVGYVVLAVVLHLSGLGSLHVANRSLRRVLVALLRGGGLRARRRIAQRSRRPALPAHHSRR